MFAIDYLKYAKNVIMKVLFTSFHKGAIDNEKTFLLIFKRH